MLTMLFMYAIFATTFVLGEESILYAPPIFFVGIRMILAGLLLLGYVRFYQKESFAIQPRHYVWFAGIVIFHIYFSYVLEFVSYSYLSGATVALLYNFAPFITALFAYFFLTEIMTPKKWLGLVIAVVASLPMIFIKEAVAVHKVSHLVELVAEVALVLSVVAACVGWIFMKKLTKDWGYSYVFVNGVGMLFGGILSLASSPLFETWPAITPLFTNIPFLRTLFLLILIGNIIVYNLYGKLLHTYSATALSLFSCSQPLFAAIFQWFWLGESVSYWFFFTAIAMSVGLYIFYQEELQQGLTSLESEQGPHGS